MSKLDQIRANALATRAAKNARINPVAKATKGKAGTAGVKGPVRRSTTGTGLRVGETVAVQPATSATMDVTAGETATKFDRDTYHRNYMRGYMRKRRAGKK